jgi:hypothetical protein
VHELLLSEIHARKLASNMLARQSLFLVSGWMRADSSRFRFDHA